MLDSFESLGQHVGRIQVCLNITNCYETFGNEITNEMITKRDVFCL